MRYHSACFLNAVSWCRSPGWRKTTPPIAAVPFQRVHCFSAVSALLSTRRLVHDASDAQSPRTEIEEQGYHVTRRLEIR